MDAETTKYEGYWWFPDNPDKKVTGILSINRREGIELRIISSLQSLYDQTSPEIILGQLINGRLITLIDSTSINSQSNPSNSAIDLSTCTYISQVAISGKRHFQSKNDIVFASADVRFSLLDEWLHKSGFNHNSEISKEGYLNKFNLKYEYPEIIEFDIHFLNSRLKTNYRFNRHHKFLKHDLTQKSFFTIKPNNPQNINWYDRTFDSLRKFVTIVSGYSVSITDFIAYGNEYNLTAKEEFIVSFKLPNTFIETFNQHPATLLTHPDHLGTELSAILNNWFDKSEKLEPAILLYDATVSIDLGYSEFRLLNYAQALEALHRRVFGGKYLTDEKYSSVCNTIVKSIPKSLERSHRDSLKGRIKYGHEFSQRKRIKLLLDEVWDDLLDQFIDNKTVFINQVINTRNYLIHYDSSSESQAVKGIKIHYLAERLKIILIAHILLQLGMPRNVVGRDIKRFANFEYLKIGREQ